MGLNAERAKRNGTLSNLCPGIEVALKIPLNDYRKTYGILWQGKGGAAEMEKWKRLQYLEVEGNGELAGSRGRCALHSRYHLHIEKLSPPFPMLIL